MKKEIVKDNGEKQEIDVDKLNKLLEDEDDKKNNKKSDKKSKIEIEDNISKEEINKENNQLFYCRNCNKTFEKSKKIYKDYLDFTTGKSRKMTTIHCDHCNGTRWSVTKYLEKNLKDEIKEKLNLKINLNNFSLISLFIWDIFTDALSILIINIVKIFIYFQGEIINGIKLLLNFCFILFFTKYIKSFLNINFIYNNYNYSYLISLILILIMFVLIKWRK